MFEKATKEGAKLRAAFFGPSGAGKTYTALRVAKGIGGKVALIDSERRSARKYSDRLCCWSFNGSGLPVLPQGRR